MWLTLLSFLYLSNPPARSVITSSVVIGPDFTLDVSAVMYEPSDPRSNSQFSTSFVAFASAVVASEYYQGRCVR